MEPLPATSFRVERLLDAPIIHPDTPGLEGELGANINGPSLLRVPDWIAAPLGRYYLYFAHHGGHHIRLAYADALTGPWTILPGGVLHRDQGPGRGHIASPDIHVDPGTQQLRLYFHQPYADSGQLSFVALSADGLRFEARPEVLGRFYFRVFRHGEWHYAYAKNTNVDGLLYRSPDGLRAFEPGPSFLPGIRHAAVWIQGETGHLFYSVAGDTPERILVSQLDLTRPWPDWQPSPPEVVLEPETAWEGADLPLEPSQYGASHGRVRQLRDPAIYVEGDELYLLYSVAGEKGIAIARLERR